MRLPLALACLALPGSALAQTFDLTLNQAAIDAGVDEAALEAQMNDALAGALKLGDPQIHQDFINSMVEAAAIGAKGMGVDYASNIEKFVAGGAIASGVQEAGFTFQRGGDLLPEGGYAAQLTLMAGINLGMGGKEKGFGDRFRLYVNGLGMRLPSNRQFGGKMANLGGHLQIKLIGGPDAEIVEWGGIDLTSGFEYTAYAFDLRQSLPIEAPMGGGGTATWTANGAYNINSDVMSVPIELSTNVRVFVISGYLGGAFDYNMGTGTSRAELDGPIDGKLDVGGTTFDGELGTASVFAAADGVSAPMVFRMFAGAQVNILVLKGFAHLNVEPQNGAIGGNVGFRVAM